jgi:predicted flap endonuclease-1-like 5' DNA nuclease
MEEERARMRQQEELAKELEGLRERNAKAEEDLKASRTRLTELAAQKAEMEKLQAALNESEAASARHGQRLSEADSRIASLEAELESLRKASAAGTTSTLAATTVEAVATEPVVPDDLKRVEGIGPKLEQMLNEHGIHTFAKLAATAVSDLQAILEKGGDAYRIHDPGTWPQQAGLLAEGRTEEFEALTARLKGGRDVD